MSHPYAGRDTMLRAANRLYAIGTRTGASDADMHQVFAVMFQPPGGVHDHSKKRRCVDCGRMCSKGAERCAPCNWAWRKRGRVG